jgi:hypothetical protein
MIAMADEKDILLGSLGSPLDIQDIDALKSAIVEQLIAAKVPFPIKDKRQLEDIYPRGTPKSCKFRGREISIHDLIPLLNDADFPLETPGDAAIALTSRCELNVVK